MSKSKLLEQIQYIDFTWNNKKDILKLLPHNTIVKFAIFCASQVIHLVDDHHMDLASRTLDVAKEYLVNSTARSGCVRLYKESFDLYTNELCEQMDEGITQSTSAICTISYTAAAAGFEYQAALVSSFAAEEVYKCFEKDYQTIADQMDYLEDLVLSHLNEDERKLWLTGTKI